MSKDIEMFAIGQNEEGVVGTQIFDPNMPSNLDFDSKEEDNHAESVPFKGEGIQQMGTALVLGQEVKSYSVKGKPAEYPKPHFLQGDSMKQQFHSHMVKVMDDQNREGLKKFWQAIVGYSKRQIILQQGYLYITDSNKGMHFVRSIIKFGDIFKVFVDPEEEAVRLVVRDGERLQNRDLKPQKFMFFLDQLNMQMTKVGLTLQG